MYCSGCVVINAVSSSFLLFGAEKGIIIFLKEVGLINGTCSYWIFASYSAMERYC